MSVTAGRDRLIRRGLWLAGLTIAWNVIEALVARGRTGRMGACSTGRDDQA
jgi:hypothetical protein